MMLRCLILTLTMGVSALCSYAQGTSETDAYEAFKRKALLQYGDFRQQANEQYAVFLKKAWNTFKADPVIPKPQDEKLPPVTIKEDGQKQPVDSRPIAAVNVTSPQRPRRQPKPTSPLETIPSDKEEAVDFLFFGTPCQIHINTKDRLCMKDAGNQQVADGWTRLSQRNVMDNTLRECLALRDTLALCDWAYLNLLDTFAKTVYGASNEATMLAAFLYCQSGYQMRIGRYGGKLSLLFASEHRIYGVPFFTIGNSCYYPFNLSDRQLEICDAPYPQERPLSLSMPYAQRFKYEATPQRLLVSRKYPDVKVEVQVNKNLLNFYDTYPVSEVENNFMTKWAVYANAPLDAKLKGGFYSALSKAIDGLDELEAANKLLDWVQTAFVYEYDEKVWGGDRAFFAEETLYYPYCDCEDRAILFTRLIRDLLGLKTALVYYPSHLACAVCFHENVKGDYLTFGNEHFVIADPTYIGAFVGMSMPGTDEKHISALLLH